MWQLIASPGGSKLQSYHRYLASYRLNLHACFNYMHSRARHKLAVYVLEVDWLLLESSGWSVHLENPLNMCLYYYLYLSILLRKEIIRKYSTFLLFHRFKKLMYYLEGWNLKLLLEIMWVRPLRSLILICCCYLSYIYGLQFTSNFKTFKSTNYCN